MEAVLCTVCGNVAELLKGACLNCKSTPRQRALAYGVLRALRLKKDSLHACKMDKSREGVGISDWFGIASFLANRFSYTNSYYHKFPQLDLSSPPDSAIGQFEFCTCSDVLEHVLPPLSTALEGLFSILKPGGAAIVSVPATEKGFGVHEKYPNLHDFRIVTEGDGRFCLINTTRDGATEKFYDLNFHGGPGSTLEMRLFSWNGFQSALLTAGFVDIESIDSLPELGIPARPLSGNVVVARKPV